MTLTATVGEDAPASAYDHPPITFIDFLLDETGSMTSCANETKAGFNAFVETQRDGGDCFLTLTKFDSLSIRTPYENLPISMVPPLSFYPGQMTNLYDCIGDRLTAVLAQDRSGKSLFVIMTDGGDNRSSRWNRESARTLVVSAQSQGVVVVFLGPSSTALKVGHDLGIPEGNIKPFDTSNMAETLDTLNNATTAFRAGGSTTTDNFFA